MPNTSRWLIISGYLAPFALTGVARLTLPAGESERDYWLSFGLVAGIALGGLLIVAGAITSITALVRSRSRYRWYDYALLAGAVGPLVAVAFQMFWPF